MEEEIQKISKNTFIYSIGNFAVRSVTFFLIPLYTHYLTGFEVGVIVLLELFELLYNAVAPLGMLAGLWRYFNLEKKTGREKRLISSTIIFVLGTNIVLLTILLFGSSWIAKYYLSAADLAGLFRLFLIAMFLGLSRILFHTLLRVYEHAFRFIIFVFFDVLLLIVFTLWFVIGLNLGLNGVIFSKLITAFLIFIFTISYIFFKYGFTYHRGDVNRSLRYGFPLVFGGVSLLFLSMSDRFLIKEIISVEASGVYGIAHKFGLIFNMILVTPFLQAWHPIFFRLENSPSQKLTYQKIALYFIQIGVVVWLWVSIISKYLVKLTTPAEFHSGIIIIPWVAFSYLLFGLQNIFKAGTLLQGQTWALVRFTVSCAILNIILNLLIIPRWNILGAAIASTVSYFVMLVLVLQLSQKSLPINWLWGKMLSVVALGVLFAGVGMVGLQSARLGVVKDVAVLLLLPITMIILKLVSLQEIKRFIRRFGA